MKNLLANSFFRRWTGTGFVLALSLAACTEKKSTPTPVTPTAEPDVNGDARAYGDYTELIWGDEFSGSAIDPAKWGYDTGGGGWGNNELEYYTSQPDNSFIDNGHLVIQANRQAQGGRDYTSARLLTKGKQNFKFGRIDVMAKMPQGKGLWPAIWLLGSDIAQNNWPRCGEIDMMELRGQAPNKFLTTMHFPKSDGSHDQKGTGDQVLPSGNFSDDFHLFSLVRSRGQMRFYLDSKLYYTFTTSDASIYPFNNPFFMILNVAVGGDFLGAGGSGNPDATTPFPQQMQVDYVRYYQYK